MNGQRHCETIRERIPAFVAGSLLAAPGMEVEEHLASCAECRSEVELVRLLRSARPVPPEGLAQRIRMDLRLRPMGGARPWWGLAAAAVAALALGIGVVGRGDLFPGADVPAYVATTGDMDLWLGDDGLIAGAPALEDLSDEALLTLLEEMTSGGAA